MADSSEMQGDSRRHHPVADPFTPRKLATLRREDESRRRRQLPEDVARVSAQSQSIRQVQLDAGTQLTGETRAEVVAVVDRQLLLFLRQRRQVNDHATTRQHERLQPVPRSRARNVEAKRSEEHTSELQSR